jgi:hypothetical protein
MIFVYDRMHIIRVPQRENMAWPDLMSDWFSIVIDADEG